MLNQVEIYTEKHPKDGYVTKMLPKRYESILLSQMIYTFQIRETEEINKKFGTCKEREWKLESYKCVIEALTPYLKEYCGFSDIDCITDWNFRRDQLYIQQHMENSRLKHEKKSKKK